jgi:hypothetical protein
VARELMVATEFGKLRGSSCRRQGEDRPAGVSRAGTAPPNLWSLRQRHPMDPPVVVTAEEVDRAGEIFTVAVEVVG